MKRRPALIPWLTLAVALPAVSQTHVHFSAKVTGGEGYHKTISPRLIFELHPEGADWRLAVKPDRNSDTNFADCVTGPLHGPTALDLLAWQWAPNAPAGYGLTAPQTRDFDFVLDDAGNHKACGELSREIEDSRENRNQVGDPNYNTPPLGHARVLIRSVRMQSETADNKPRFAEVSFDVEISLPGPRLKQKRPHNAASSAP